MGLLYIETCNFAALIALSHTIVIRRRFYKNYCKMNKGPISKFVAHHYRHFNAAALVDAAKG